MKITTIHQAKELADAIRAECPDLAEAIDRAIADAPRDGLNVDVGIRFRLEKFEGDKLIETIEGTG
jgi:hypothetical protein